jgi:hypothetical protein
VDSAPIISIRDVIFDEETFCGKKDLSSNKELLAHMDELVARVSLEPSQAKNEVVLEEDEEILYSERAWEDFNESSDGEDDGVLPFDEKEDLEPAYAFEEGLITPPLSDAYAVHHVPFQVIARGGPSVDGVLPFEKEDLELASAVEVGLTAPLLEAHAAHNIPFQVIERGGPSTDDGVLPCDEKKDLELARAVEVGLITAPLLEANAAHNVPFRVIERGRPSLSIQDTQSKPGIQEDGWDEQWEDFQRLRIGSAFHGIFEGHRMTRKIHKKNLPPAPKRVKDLLTHPFRTEFEAAQHEHLQFHEKIESFRRQVIDLKVPVRLYYVNLFRATTLARTTFRTFIAMAANSTSRPNKQLSF